MLVVTPGNTYLEAALLLDEYLDVTEVAPSAYPPAGAFDVTHLRRRRAGARRRTPAVSST